jgi:hypothetical protein
MNFFLKYHTNKRLATLRTPEEAKNPERPLSLFYPSPCASPDIPGDKKFPFLNLTLCGKLFRNFGKKSLFSKSLEKGVRESTTLPYTCYRKGVLMPGQWVSLHPFATILFSALLILIGCGSDWKPNW